MATLAAEMMLRCVFDGSLSLHDGDIQRRPYHKNCRCALHKLKEVCSGDCSKQKSVSFPKKKSWPDCSLSTIAAAASHNFSSHLADHSSDRNRHLEEEVGHICLWKASKSPST